MPPYIYQEINTINAATNMFKCSRSGQHLILTQMSSVNMHISHDYGFTWATKTAPVASADWFGACISADGQKMLIGTYNPVGASQIYYSHNGGDAWTGVNPQGITAPGTGFNINRGLACSDDGLTVYAPFNTNIVGQGQIWKSIDGGITWNQLLGYPINMGPASSHNIDCSPDGQFVINYGQRSGPINYTIAKSNDYGVNWNLFNDTADINGLAIGNTGQFCKSWRTQGGGRHKYSDNGSTTWNIGADQANNGFNNKLAQCSNDGQRLATFNMYSVNNGVNCVRYMDEEINLWYDNTLYGWCASKDIEYVYFSGNLTGNADYHVVVTNVAPVPPVPGGGVSYSASFAAGRGKLRRILTPYNQNDII